MMSHFTKSQKYLNKIDNLQFVQTTSMIFFQTFFKTTSLKQLISMIMMLEELD